MARPPAGFDWRQELPLRNWAAPVPPTAVEQWHPTIAGCLDYWNAKRVDAAMADRMNLDPLMEIPALCPHLIIVAPVIRDDRLVDFTYRLAGTHVEQSVGRGLRGLLVSQFTGPIREHHFGQRLCMSFEKGRVTHRRGLAMMVPGDRYFGRVENVTMPLSHGGSTPALVLVAVLYGDFD